MRPSPVVESWVRTAPVLVFRDLIDPATIIMRLHVVDRLGGEPCLLSRSCYVVKQTFGSLFVPHISFEKLPVAIIPGGDPRLSQLAHDISAEAPWFGNQND